MATEFIDITPDKSLFAKLGNSGYSLDESISELVDNSIDAANQDLVIEIKISDNEISIQDNGNGMNKDEIINALKLGASKKENQLGKFGLGMKTSCLSLGKNFSIKTSENKEEVFKVNYSQEEWMEKGKWHEFPLEIKKESSQKGTKITISELIVNLNEKSLSKLKKHLGTRFGLFIKEGMAKIYINDEICSKQIPELIEKEKNKFELDLDNGISVCGWFGFKVAENSKHNFGFNTYRNKRLITFYDKTGLSSTQKSKQIIGEIHLNHIPVTHNKRGWIKESLEYKAFEKKFIEFLRIYDKRMKKLVIGSSACLGRVVGKVKFLDSYQFGDKRAENFEEVEEGDIIVTQMTRPDMVLYLQKAKAIITDLGGTLSHAGIVSREFNIPCIVGTGNATNVLKDGQKIIVDATEGVVYDGE